MGKGVTLSSALAVRKGKKSKINTNMIKVERIAFLISLNMSRSGQNYHFDYAHFVCAITRAVI